MRGRRLLRGLFAGAVLTLAVTFGMAPAAHAATGDSYDSWDVQATLNTDGTVDVVETVTLRFGSGSGRHGLERTLFTREPDPDTGMDMLFPVTGISAESLSPGVSGMTDLSYQQVDGNPRQVYLRIRIGDPERTISADTATYRLRYTIAGLMRSPGGVDQLYWDMTGSSLGTINDFTATITVPGGAQAAGCSIAASGSQGACTATVDDQGRVTIAEDTVPAGQLLTVGVRVTPGLVSPNTPLFDEDALAAEQSLGRGILLGSTGAGALVAVGGWAYLRGRTGDRRFEGLPPGVLPAADQTATEVRNPRKLEIPVAFAPPRLSLAEAGLLLDGAGQVRHTTATLVGLAVNGAIRLRSEEPPQAWLIDADRAPDRPSKALVKALFSDGETADLSTPGSMTAADRAVQRKASELSDRGNWFLSRPQLGSAGAITMVLLVLMLGMGAVVLIGSIALNLWPLGLAVAITGLVVALKLSQARRTGTGRALTDQVEGFRTYLATAEADQLQFEEGEDIFSKYLPWAILFDLTARWTRLCEQLVAMGRLSSQAPDWYAGSTWDLHLMAWQLNQMSTHVATAVAPPPPPPSASDSGFGSGGSAFGGGGGFSGFSGGGGGGGGGGSW
ncbi:MAG: DUF2207 domain-containing protein [Actinobacteria bacterium]|nr:DUF2207 domain-containing protein [Actinomycetota bacterium]